jgi:hypothetical protein
MVTHAAGPLGNWPAGLEVEVSAEQGAALIQSHAAVLVSGNDGRYTAAVGGAKVETAMLAPAEPIPVPVETRAPVEVVDLVLTFGKHKGEKLSEIFAKDPGYVRGFLTHNDDPEIAAAAKAIVG